MTSRRKQGGFLAALVAAVAGLVLGIVAPALAGGSDGGSLTYQGQGIKSDGTVDQQCDAQNDAYLLFVFTGGSATNVQLSGIAVTDTKVTNGSVHFTTPYVDPPSSLIGKVKVSWDGDAGANPQLVISHGCSGETPPPPAKDLTVSTSCGQVTFQNDNPFEVNIQYDADNAVGGSFEESQNIAAGGSITIDTTQTTFRFYAYGASDDGSTVLDEPGSVDVPQDCGPTVVQVPPTPDVNDACGPNNATWVVPADTEAFKWTLQDNGHLVVTIVADNTTFPDGSTSHDFGTAPDSNEACPPTPVSPTAPTSVDKCEPSHGPTNDGVNIPADDNFTYVDKATGETLATGFTRVEGASITVDAVANQGVTAQEGATTEWPFTFTKNDCPAPPPHHHHHHTPPGHHHHGHQPPVCHGVVKNGVCLPSTTSETGMGPEVKSLVVAPASSTGSLGDSLYLYGLVGLIAAGGITLLTLRRKPAPARHKSDE
jgi:hypothetical protein